MKTIILILFPFVAFAQGNIDNYFPIQSDTSFTYDTSSNTLSIGDIGDTNVYEGVAKIGIKSDSTKPNIIDTLSADATSIGITYHGLISLGTSGTVMYFEGPDTIPVFLLITTIDSMWVNVNSPKPSNEKPGEWIVTTLVYVQPNYQKVEFLNTKTVRGYLVRNYLYEQTYLDENKKPFPKSTIIWQAKR